MAAVMFKVEAAFRTGLTSAACTSEACRYFSKFPFNIILSIRNDVRIQIQPLEMCEMPVDMN